MSHPWISRRTAAFDSSGIRKVFDLAAALEDPINLSIGQPDFDVPERIQEAAIEAIRGGRNGYTVTQGIPALREALQAEVDRALGHDDRRLLVTSGTSGALVLALLALVDPGDEVIVPDPYFVMYPALVEMVGGRVVYVDTYPDFRLDPEQVAAAITPRTKVILANSPANPTGAVATAADTRGLAELAAERNIALISDEIYSRFAYDAPTVGPALHNPATIVIDGFSKTYGVTGWRVGWVHGPAEVVDAMTKLQQYTFVCAPQPAQWGCAAALEVDMQPQIDAFRRRRDLVVEGLADCYRLTRPGGAFYVFPEAPGGDGAAFVERAIKRGLLIIPGSVFSRRDTHFRISYAASEETLARGIDVLRELAAEMA